MFRDCQPSLSPSSSISETEEALTLRNWCETMTHVYRISKGLDVGDIVDPTEFVEAFSRDNVPGRYEYIDRLRKGLDRNEDSDLRVLW
jgi:hypothetical protein